MIDLSKMESLEKHIKNVKEWERYMSFQKLVSSRGKIEQKNEAPGKQTIVKKTK